MTEIVIPRRPRISQSLKATIRTLVGKRVHPKSSIPGIPAYQNIFHNYHAFLWQPFAVFAKEWYYVEWTYIVGQRILRGSGEGTSPPQSPRLKSATQTRFVLCSMTSNIKSQSWSFIMPSIIFQLLLLVSAPVLLILTVYFYLVPNSIKVHAKRIRSNDSRIPCWRSLRIHDGENFPQGLQASPL